MTAGLPTELGLLGLFAILVVKELVVLVKWAVSRRGNGDSAAASNSHTNGVVRLENDRLTHAIDNLSEATHQQTVLLERLNGNVSEMRRDLDRALGGRN